MNVIQNEHDRLVDEILTSVPIGTGRLHHQIKLELLHVNLTRSNLLMWKRRMLEKYVLHNMRSVGESELYTRPIRSVGISGTYPTATFFDEVNEFYLSQVSAAIGIPKRFFSREVTINNRMAYKNTSMEEDFKVLWRMRLLRNGHPTDSELNVIKLMIDKELSAETILHAYLICAVCKSSIISKSVFPCHNCNIIDQWTTSLYKYKDSICKFCSDELGRIKLGLNTAPIGKNGLII